MRRSLLAGSPFVIMLFACGHGRAHQTGTLQEPGSVLITEAAIVQSGGTTAWEVLKRTVPYVHFGETRSGQPARIVRRGRSSLVLNDAPLVFIDGVKIADLRMLTQIPANQLLRISVLNGIDGTTYYGTNAVGGVIRIETKNGTELE